MSKKIGIIVIACVLIFGGYFYFFSRDYFKSMTSVIVDGDQIRLDVGDFVRYSNDSRGVYFNDKQVGKKLEIFNGIELSDDYFEVVNELDNYLEDDDFRDDRIVIYFGYKVVEKEIIDLEYYELDSISSYKRNDFDEDIILYTITFDYSEVDYMHFVKKISINYVGKGEHL